MKEILASRHGSALDGLGRGRALAIFDYDGTLAPLVADPAKARMRPATRRRLSTLAGLLQVAILSGRSLADLSPLVDGLGSVVCVGNHGLERPLRPGHWPATQRLLERRVSRWMVRLAGLQAIGARLEGKGLSLSIHLKGMDRRARELARRQAKALPGGRVVSGKETLNVLPAGQGGKAEAVRWLARTLAAETVLFVGDDLTDEEVFEARHPRPLIGVHVGPGASRAEYWLREQADIDELLGRLIDLRRDDRRALRKCGGA